jgi:hypothetical protein
MGKTIERKTADVILQAKQHITLNGKKYAVAQPTLATLIEVSAMVSELPQVNFRQEELVGDVLREARGFRGLADIAALMMVGVSNHWLRKWLCLYRRKRLARQLLDIDITELNAAIGTLLRNMHTEDFFVIASFLTNINLTKATRKEATMTASGQ